MRPKLALLVAATVVFAPGWVTSDDSAAGPAGGPLAGRILAPAVDEANLAADTAAAKPKRIERVKPRAGSWNAVAWRSAAPSPPASAWGPLPVSPAAGTAAIASSTTSTRAPPAS